MNMIKLDEISSLISTWLHNLSDEQALIPSKELVRKAQNLVIYLQPKNEDEVFLKLCALNLLNAAIKTESFKDHLPYDLIKTNAAKLITVIDGLKTNNISYYFNIEEYCLFYKLGSIVFCFHNVPWTNEILKACFSHPILWPGIRLQKVAQPLLTQAIKSIEDDIEIKDIIEKESYNIVENNDEHETYTPIDNKNQDNNIYKVNTTSINDNFSEIKTITDDERNHITKKILSIIRQNCVPDSEGWFDLVKIAPKLIDNGIDYSLYGYHKLGLFLEAIFGDSMQRQNVGSMVYLRFPLGNIQNKSNITKITNYVDRDQDILDILKGVKIGDDVEISTYGILKSGKISLLNKHYVQLELKDNRSFRIKCDAISSIELKFSSNSVTSIDLSFANVILKNILVTEGLYTSSTIDTNATITIVESRRIWLTTDDGNTGSCYKGSIIGYDKEKLVKGQRIYAFPFKKEKAYCVIMEMSYYQLYNIFEDLLSASNKVSDIKRVQILSLLTYLTVKINHLDSLQKLKDLKKRLKSLLPSSTSSMDDSVEEYIKNDDLIGMDSSQEVTGEDKTSFVDTDVNHLDNDNNHAGSSDLTDIGKPKKKEGEENNTITNEPKDSISINITKDLLPSMGKIIKICSAYGFIQPHNLENQLYFKTSELISYSGIIDAPSVGDEVVYSLGQNAKGPIAVCIHKQCTRDSVEELVEKYRYSTIICSRLKKHIEDFDKLNSDNNFDTARLVYYLEKVGITTKNPFSPDGVEKLFAEKLSSDEYVVAIELLIDEVVKKDSSKCYNLFLRSSSYARTHKKYDVAKHLIEKALDVFKGESGKTKYFKGLLRSISTLSKRIEIDEKSLEVSLDISSHAFPFMPTYVHDVILSYKDFNGITPDTETIRTGLYKEEYIEELRDSIKQNNADDLLYLTMIKLQLAFHAKEYNPKDDISKFLVSRAKNILATGDKNRYSEVRYLFRLAYRLNEKGYDNTVGLYLMTLGDYTASEIDMFMNKGDRSDYRFDDLLKNILANKDENSLELTLLADLNIDIKNRIIREYEKIGKNVDCFDVFPTIVKEVKKRYIQYSANPVINFMSLISYLSTTEILLDNELNVVKNDSVKIVSYITDFNTGQKYNVILEAYNNIVQKIEAIIPTLISHPTEIGYETILPALKLLKKDVRKKFVELEQRLNPTISIDILEAVELEDNNSIELKVEIRNSGDSARSIHLNRLKASGVDLLEENNINIDVRLTAGEEKVVNIELHLGDNAVKVKTAEVEFEIDYDDIYIATDKREPKSSKIYKTINLEIKSFVEIENRFRQCAGGEELEPGDTMFYGRSSLIKKIKEAIVTGTKNQIAIYGQKRSGKSSLLNQIKGRLESDESHSIICGKFSLQGLPDDELNPVRWILEFIAKSLLQGIRMHSDIKLNKTEISKFFSDESDAFKALGDFIDYINSFDDLKGSHYVIFIDEFTYLYQLIKDRKVKDDFMRRWIALIESPGINLQVIVAAQDTFPHFLNESYASNYFNKFSKEPLSYLNKEEALQLIKNPIESVKFHNHSEELIFEYTAGSAFFIQIFCSRLVDYLNFEKNTNVVGKEEIGTVAERLCAGTHRLEKSTFECLTKEADGSDFDESDNIKVLKAIAEHTRAGGYVSVEDLKVDLSQEKTKSVLDNLYERRVISKQNDGYSIYVKLFVKWILNN